MTDAKKIALETSLDTRPVKDGFQQIVQAAESTATGVKNASDRAGKAVDAIGTGADAAAKKIEGAERSIIASIQRRTAAVQAAGQSESKYYEELARQRGVNVDTLRPYLQQLDAAKARQDAASASLGNMGVSAKQTAAALRGVPAQFTDIITSIQGGQAPLTVFLQQGGQLRDMFGGAGAAARALGGYVVGLINPFTIAAGALGAIAAAAYQGANEMQAFNKTLILSGNTSGVTGDRLMTIAAGIKAANDSITQSKAAEALNLMVEAGVRGEQQLGRYAKAAVEFEKAGGGAASEVAKQFSALAKDPLQASVKLNEAMGYLSSSVAETIRSLEAQGKTVEAARVAQNAYADAIENRTPRLVENIGYLESAWKKVAGAAAQAWDRALNVGRAETQEEQLGRVRTMISNKLPGAGKYGGVVDRELDYLREQEKRLSTNIAYNQRDATLSAEKAQREKERTAFLGQADKYLSSEQRQQRDILAVQNLVTRQIISQEEAEKRIAAIRASNAKSSGGGARTSRTQRDEFADVYNRVTMKEVGLDPSFYKDLNTLYDGYQKGRIGIDQYRESVESLVSVQRFAVEAQKAQTAAAVAAGQANNAAFDAEFEAIEKKRLSNEAQIRTGREMLEQLQFETSLLGMNTAEREQAIAMRDLERAGLVAGTQAYAAYAEQIKNAIISRDQQQQMMSFWRDVDQTAESVFMDIAMNGEDAFKRIGESIKREILQMLYEMTVKKWIIQVSGQTSLGGGGGTNWLDMAQQAYSAYTGGASGAASTYSLASGSSSGLGLSSGAAGTGFTASGGTGFTASATTTTAASASGSAAASSSAWMTAAWYAAVIVAAVAVAENLYSKGYNRKALGDGGSETVRFGQYSSYTTDPNIQKSQFYDIGLLNLEAKNQRALQDALGFSEKWADILSGTTRMATLIGRKLGAYGFQADVAGGDADVSGFARYKGGLFRSNKTVGVDIDQRDAAAFDAIVESTIEGSRAMARAMGLSEEAINNYTGSIRVNMKNAETAEEQSKRMAEAMDNLQFSLLKAAAGGKYSRDEFEKMMDGVRKSIDAAGISTQGLADIILAGMTGRLSRADVGAQLSEVIIGGIYNSIASNYAGMIAQAFTSQIITPIFTALAAGVPISQAISQAAISNVVATAQAAAQALNAIFSSAEFMGAIGGIQQAISGVAGAATSVRAPSFRAPSAANTAASDAAREKEQLEREWLRLTDNTAELRRRELLDLQPGNRALQQRIWMLEDEQAITAERNDLERQRMEILNDTAGLRKLERDALNESNRALYDQIQALKDAAELKDVWRDLTDSIEQEIKRIRGDVLGEGANGLAYAQAQFAITTSQARALDQQAAGQLPDLAGRLVELLQTNAGSRADYEFEVNRTLASLEETNRITRNLTGVTETTSSVEDKALAKKVEALQLSIDSLKEAMKESNLSAQVSADALKKASTGAGLRVVVTK